jgi:glycopeptide antibiotics resistance protein
MWDAREVCRGYASSPVLLHLSRLARSQSMLDGNKADAASLVIGLLPALLCVLLWAAIVVFLRIKKNKDLVYFACFTIFSLYLYKVLDYTLFQFQSLLLLKHFVPDLILNGIAREERVNLVPLATLTHGDLRTSLLNVVMMVPFGFGLPFITKFRTLKVVAIGALFSLSIELLQLTTGLLARMTFRVADINDVVFNTIGVAAGCLLFVAYTRSFPRWQLTDPNSNPRVHGQP